MKKGKADTGPNQTMKRLTFDIPADVHRRLKIHSAESRTPIRILILEWIQQHLPKPK
jgi:hypothetical protein